MHLIAGNGSYNNRCGDVHQVNRKSEDEFVTNMCSLQGRNG